MTQQTKTDGKTDGNGAEKTPETTGSESETLDTLISEYEKGIAQTATAQIPRILKAFKPVHEYVENERLTKAIEQEQNDVKQAWEFVKTEAKVPDTVPKRVIAGYLRDYVAETPGAIKAWEERRSNPDAWKAHQLAAAKEIRETWLEKQVEDKIGNVRSDIDKAKAAVRNVSTEPAKLPAFDPVEAFNMSDHDWKLYMQKAQAMTAANRKG